MLAVARAWPAIDVLALIAPSGQQGGAKAGTLPVGPRRLDHDAPQMGVLVKGDPAAQITDLENVEIVFKAGVGYDSHPLVDATSGSGRRFLIDERPGRSETHEETDASPSSTDRLDHQAVCGDRPLYCNLIQRTAFNSLVGVSGES
jgi:hypothetical protein